MGPFINHYPWGGINIKKTTLVGTETFPSQADCVFPPSLIDVAVLMAAATQGPCAQLIYSRAFVFFKGTMLTSQGDFGMPP